MRTPRHTLRLRSTLAGLTLALCTTPVLVQAQSEEDNSMSFFITSTNLEGADLGGLEGADAHCSALAEDAGVTGKTWRAYLSTSDVDARDRIGEGPWHNANGELVAHSLEDLHYSNVNFTKETALDENGEEVNGRTDSPNQHDILTGTNPDGTASDFTCEDWTSNSESGQAMVGHHDRTGGGPMPTSWNASHPSRGCSLENLQSSGGNGYFYCFAE